MHDIITYKCINIGNIQYKERYINVYINEYNIYIKSYDIPRANITIVCLYYYHLYMYISVYLYMFKHNYIARVNYV